MFKYIIPEYNPSTLVKRYLANDDFTFDVKVLEGLHYRTFPTTGREVRFLEMLSKGNTIHVPEHGDGVIVNADIIDSVQR
jgi:hypothetical protein